MKHIPEAIEDENVVILSLLQGGKLPPRKGNNWLSKLTLHTVFNVRIPNSKVDLIRCQVFEKYGNSTTLVFFIPREEPIVKDVSTIDFSNEYELMDIITYGDPDNRTDLDRRLEVNENIEQDNTVVGETGQS